MRFVSLKTEAQLDLQALHRECERLVRALAALVNQLRAVLLERGIILPKGRSALMRRLVDLGIGRLATSARTRVGRGLKGGVRHARSEDQGLRRRVCRTGAGRCPCALTIRNPRYRSDERYGAACGGRRRQRLRPRRGLAAELGLTPRPHSTGGRTKMISISKRGNRYLRKQLIHGARAALPHLAPSRREWAIG